MSWYRIAMAVLALICIITGNGMAIGQQRKKAAPTVKAHRATIVQNLHPVVSRKAQFSYAGMPKWGSIVAALPPRAIMVKTGNDSFYYRNGIYYVQQAKGFMITRPTPGLRVQGLPFGYRLAPAKKENYFYYYGTFYAPAGNSDYYEVIAAPEEAVVDAIPDGYEIRKIGDEEYYFLGGVYYAEVDAPALKEKIGYQVVTIIQEY